MKYSLLAFLLLLTPLVAEEALRDELVRMARLEQDYRMELIHKEAEMREHDSALREKICEIDRVHADRLKEIIAENGWPRKSQVGEKASKAAWLIAQHATHDPDFQEEVLRLLSPLVTAKEVDPEQFALLADRVAAHRGEPQVYGTQYEHSWCDGELCLNPCCPIHEEHALDARRAEIGLCPHQEYLQRLEQLVSGQKDR